MRLPRHACLTSSSKCNKRINSTRRSPKVREITKLVGTMGYTGSCRYLRAEAIEFMLARAAAPSRRTLACSLPTFASPAALTMTLKASSLLSASATRLLPCQIL